ncbi:hypothetical protein [Lacibacter cauensis]|uniref:hypothetical protein n=1 Tax=Lacibacter cauensis TaxID=510947 RepID=UPI0011A84F8B|nr:hypothetical protein [Lacibacter cauensis]
MEKVIDLNFSAIATEWELLLQYNKLRNQLVHSSEKRKITKELEESVKKINGVEIIKNEFGTEFFFANIFALTDLRNIIEKILDHLNFEKSNSKTE